MSIPKFKTVLRATTLYNMRAVKREFVKVQFVCHILMSSEACSNMQLFIRM